MLGGVGNVVVVFVLVRFTRRVGGSSSSSESVRSITCAMGRFELTVLGRAAGVAEEEAVVRGVEMLVIEAGPLLRRGGCGESSSEMRSLPANSSSDSSGMGELEDSAATDHFPSGSIVTDSTVLGVLASMSSKYLSTTSCLKKTVWLHVGQFHVGACCCSCRNEVAS